MARIFKGVNARKQQRYLVQLDEQEFQYLTRVLERYCEGKGSMDVEHGTAKTANGFPARLLQQVKEIKRC